MTGQLQCKVYGSRQAVVLEHQGRFTRYPLVPCREDCRRSPLLVLDKCFWGGRVAVSSLRESCRRTCLRQEESVTGHGLPFLFSLKVEDTEQALKCVVNDRKYSFTFTCDKSLCNGCRVKKLFEGTCPYAVCDITALVLFNGSENLYRQLTKDERPVPGKAKQYFRYWDFADGSTIFCRRPYSRMEPGLLFSHWLSDSQIDDFLNGRSILRQKSHYFLLGKRSEQCEYTLRNYCGWNFSCTYSGKRAGA